MKKTTPGHRHQLFEGLQYLGHRNPSSVCGVECTANGRLHVRLAHIIDYIVLVACDVGMHVIVIVLRQTVADGM